MQPDERLDALLSHRQSGIEPDVWSDGAGTAKAGSPGTAGTDDVERAADEANSLAQVADRFAVWGRADPSPAFADRLEAELLERFAAKPDQASPRDNNPAPLHPARSPSRRPRARRLRWQALAASVLLLLGTGAVAVAAAGATPGQPLYNLHRLEQGVRADLASGQTERIRLHLRYAQDALSACDLAVADHSGDETFTIALTTFTEEERAASDGMVTLPHGAERDDLAEQLGALRARARHDLRAALPALNWPARANTTAVLGQVGDSVPQITETSVSGTATDGAYVWTITIHGAGFTSGAVLLVDSRPLGKVVSLSSTTLIAQLAGDQLSNGSHTFGVGNPDGTATFVTQITSNAGPDDHGSHGGHSGQGTPAPQSTSGPDDQHGGSGGGAGSGSGGGSDDDHGGSSSGSGGPTSPTPTPKP